MFEGILAGLGELAQPITLIALFGGTLLGLIVGSLPGLNDSITMAVLIPITFGMSREMALGLLIGIYCASACGGSIPAILLKIPGTASATVTSFDGYPMAQQGRPGEALGYAATLWALMDINDRRMLPPGDVARVLPDNSDLPLPMGLPATVDTVNGEENVMRRVPMYFDLDVNQHVNNTRYADWACDALGVDVMRKDCLETLLVNLSAEVRPDQTIMLHTAVSENQFRVAGYHEDKMHFELGGKLRERETA